MTLRPRILATVLLLGICLSSASAHAEDCTPKRQEAAENGVDALHAWPDILAFYESYRVCDDGGVADGLTEAVVRLLADHWDRLPALAVAIAQEPAFRPFVLSHIDSTADTGDLQMIESSATRNCPRDLSMLCKSVAQAAALALK